MGKKRKSKKRGHSPSLAELRKPGAVSTTKAGKSKTPKPKRVGKRESEVLAVLEFMASRARKRA